MLGQRRGTNEKDRQTVVEVGAEGAFLGVLGKRAMGGGNNTHVDLESLVVAHPLQLAALDEAKQLRLQGQRHLTDLVEKERAAVGGLDASHPALHRAGKGAAGVSEELRFEQRLGNGRAINGDKWFAASQGEAVQRFGDQFLARPGRPFNKNGSGAGSDQAMRRLTSSMQGALPISSGRRSPTVASPAAHGSLFDDHGGDARTHRDKAAGEFQTAASSLNRVRLKRLCRGEGGRGRIRRNFTEQGIGPIEDRPGIPGRGVRVLAAAQGIEEFLAIGSARALLRGRPVGGHQLDAGKTHAEIGKKLRQIEIGEPGIDDDGFGKSGFRLGPCLGAAIGLAHLPAQPGEDLGEPLTEAAIGTGHQGRTRPAAAERSGNGGN